MGKWKRREIGRKDCREEKKDQFNCSSPENNQAEISSAASFGSPCSKKTFKTIKNVLLSIPLTFGTTQSIGSTQA